MTSAEAAFLASVTADRRDDTARLAYVDWLDEVCRPEAPDVAGPGAHAVQLTTR
jgi:uncharacterized protein (TIGR02996 family)